MGLILYKLVESVRVDGTLESCELPSSRALTVVDVGAVEHERVVLIEGQRALDVPSRVVKG